MSKQDPGSNYAIEDVLDAKSRTAATVFSAAVDHVTGECASFLVSVGVWATSLVVTVQTSDDNMAWADQTVDGSGNDVSVTITEAGSAQLDVPNPINRYTRLKLVLGGTCVLSVASILGPLLTVEAADTTMS